MIPRRQHLFTKASRGSCRSKVNNHFSFFFLHFFIHSFLFFCLFFFFSSFFLTSFLQHEQANQDGINGGFYRLGQYSKSNQCRVRSTSISLWLRITLNK
ncbi:hypothetical protein BO82DRAFT_38619 [Aspergillus uvarum CBS 121591]|uniref:Uncharacterized protein n=1 Tax=Aspergillus uvarum CBS 121591 TaxID=1448315 RepID=A0A319CKM1_9EURO|nr:hypothetical protein BO82DRAFT_38619 [Aspergillus uvarum CBS 121591]PYH83677.1 hypothetical protein BO82DRAFT_38619 [Aspergillus uvarum CBS 121591]